MSMTSQRWDSMSAKRKDALGKPSILSFILFKGSRVQQAAVKPTADSDTLSSVKRMKKNNQRAARVAKERTQAKRNFILQFYIKWKGYDDNSNTWELEEHLR